MLQHRWTLTTSCPVKKIRCERPHIVWFNLYEISRQENFTVETESKLTAQSSLKVGVGDEDWLLINSEFLWRLIKMFQNYIVIKDVQVCDYPLPKSHTHTLSRYSTGYVKYLSVTVPWAYTENCWLESSKYESCSLIKKWLFL